MKTLCAQLGHQSLRIIDNQGSFDDKKSSILNEILHLLGHPTPLEIEAKHLVSPSPPLGYQYRMQKLQQLNTTLMPPQGYESWVTRGAKK